MKSKEELEELKQEYESLIIKLQELSDDDLLLVTGGAGLEIPYDATTKSHS